MLTRFLTPTAIKVLLGIIAALLVALGIVAWRADRISADRDKQRDLLARSEAQHAVTRASLDGLTQEMERMVKDGELRRKRLDEAMAEAGHGADELKRQADAIATDAAGDPCVTPGAVLKAKGL